MGIGDWFNENILGAKNNAKAEAVPINEQAYEYGGRYGGADEAANRYKQIGENAQGREAAQANYGAAIHAGLNPAMQARGDMNTVGQAQLARALGRVPSIAQMQADRQMGQASAQQAALAASARGRGGLANAGLAAANNTANAHGAISNQAQINAAQERADAERAAASTFGNMGMLDQQRMGQLAQMSQYQATNQMQQKELNDRMQLGMTSNEIGVRGAQLGAAQNRESQYSSNYYNAAGINAGVGGQNASMNQSTGYGLIGMAGQVAGGVATGGGGGGSVTGRADGGPVDANTPYLVGERGPELVVPKNDAMVIPSEVTVPMLSTWGRGTSTEGVGERARDQQSNEAARVTNEANQAAAQESPWEREVRRHKTLTAMGDREGAAMVAPGFQRSRAVLRGAKNASGRQEAEPKEDAQEKQAVVEGKAVPKTPDLRSRIGNALGTVHDGATKLANAVDTGYRGPQSFAGPQLIPVQAPPRANGGPMSGGMPYTVGERGPEMVVPMVGGGNPAGLTQLSGGGMDVLGSLKAHSDFATRFQRDPTGGMVAREDGGPVAQGQTALVGERGPELVVPQTSLLSRLGDSFRSAIGMVPAVTQAPPAEPRTPRYAEISSGAPRTTGAAPGLKMVVGSHGYAAEKAPRESKDKEVVRQTRAQTADIKEHDEDDEKTKRGAKK